MEKQRILIVDDDENIAELISLYLLKECFATEIAYTGKDALALAATFNPDLILLDIMLPDMVGLKLGADDYMIKPFDSNELVARVKAVLRRTVMTQAVTTAAPVSIAEVTDHQGEFVEYDGLLINMTNYTVTLDGESVEMPPKELELLYFLAKRPNQVFTRDQLLDRLWDYEYAGDSRTVDVHIKRLREKLNENHNWSISTVWGKGYKFEVK